MPKGTSGGKRGKNQIDGRPVVKSTEGWHFWNIGKNAPKGYIGLIENNWKPGPGNKTAYFKTKYADEIANFGSAGSIAMNYDKMSTLNAQITARENRLKRTTGALKTRREQELAEMKRAREIRKSLGL